MDRLKEISYSLAMTKDEKLISHFLKSILTKSEIEDISSRWELVKLLSEGMSQRKVSEKLGVSLCKITRGSKQLQRKPSPLLYMIKKYYRRRKVR